MFKHLLVQMFTILHAVAFVTQKNSPFTTTLNDINTIWSYIINRRFYFGCFYFKFLHWRTYKCIYVNII